MQNPKLIIENFLINHNCHYGNLNCQLFIRDFINHMQQGLTNNPLSLPMLPSFIQPQKQILVNKDVIAIDAGGTNLRVALVRVSASGCQIKKLKQVSMPGSRFEVPAQKLFDTIADLIKSIVSPRKYSIGFCFSYPVELLENKDAKVIAMSKDIKITGIKNTTLVQPLLNTIYQAMPSIEISKVVVLNDTVATYLSAISLQSLAMENNCMGVILGTGFNICYTENNCNISKIALNENGYQIINIEAGLFNQLNIGKVDELVNKKYTNNLAPLEQQISGKFLPDIINCAVGLAIQDKIFSEHFSQSYKCYDDAKQISKFLEYPNENTNYSADDTQLLYYLIDCLLERAAINFACTLIAVAKKTGVGKNPINPVIVPIEGTTFYKMYSLQNKIKYFLKQERPDFYYRFVKIENSSLIGSAIASLS